MSKKALFDLLEEQHKFLSGDRTTRISKKTGKVKKSKSIYRETKSDKKPTVAGTNVDTLTEEVMAEIKRKNDIKESDIKPVVEKHAKIYVSSLYKYFASGDGSMSNPNTAKNFKVRLIGGPTAFGVGVRARQGGKPFRLIQDGASGTADGSKRKKVLVDSINDELELKEKLTPLSLNVTHQEGSAVATQREAVVLEAIQKFMVTRLNQKEIQRVLQQEDVETKRITHELLTTGKFFDIMTLRVGIGSGGENKSQGAGDDEQGAIKDLKDDLIAMMSSYKDPGSLEGSDTPAKRVRKKVLHTLKKELKNKNIKVKFENTKIDLKAQRAKRKDKGKKATGIPFKGDNSTTGGRGRKRQSGTGQAQSFMQLAGLINQKLPRTVMKNMKPPGLENVTGRFASSVRVTDVTATPKGFPSIGYTYEKNPYQVFEMGQGAAPWATLDRDPRNVIDRSIREIAAEMAIGRFFTRRV